MQSQRACQKFSGEMPTAQTAKAGRHPLGTSIVKAEEPAAPKPWLEHDQNILGLCGCSFLLRGQRWVVSPAAIPAGLSAAYVVRKRAVSWLS